MEAAAQLNAKMPNMLFIPDSEKKKSEASDAAKRAAAEWVEPLYKKLETIRCGADAQSI